MMRGHAGGHSILVDRSRSTMEKVRLDLASSSESIHCVLGMVLHALFNATTVHARRMATAELFRQIPSSARHSSHSRRRVQQQSLS